MHAAVGGDGRHVVIVRCDVPKRHEVVRRRDRSLYVNVDLALLVLLLVVQTHIAGKHRTARGQIEVLCRTTQGTQTDCLVRGRGEARRGN